LKGFFFSVSWNEFSWRINASAFSSSPLRIGGSFMQNASYVLILYECPPLVVCMYMFVCRLVTSIQTSIASAGTFVFSMKFVKSVVSLRYAFRCCAKG